MSWLVGSLLLSVVLTVVLNVAVRAFPGSADRAVSRLASPDRGTRWSGGSGVRVFFPWKAMLIGSIVLTVLVNLLAR